MPLRAVGLYPESRLIPFEIDVIGFIACEG